MFGLLHGEYVDAEPGHWLVWRGGGIYGRDLYACAEHRGDLTAHLRRHYGTLGWHPWKRPPYRRYPHREDPERERRIRRLAVGPRWAGRL